MPTHIVAHRGATTRAPQNTIAAFRAALAMGADAVELDVRLTSDRIPVVYHYAYLDEATSGRGPIWEYTLADLQSFRVGDADSHEHIPTLAEVLEEFAGRIGLEIELKGPEPEAITAVVRLLSAVRAHWGQIEVTSYEPLMGTVDGGGGARRPVGAYGRSDPKLEMDRVPRGLPFTKSSG